MTTINDINDLARILREQPEWVDTLRSLLLSQELLALPERFADFVKLTDANFRLVNQRLDNLEVDVAELKTDMAEVKADVAELKTDVAELKTDMAEVKADVAELKTDVAELKTDMAEVKADVAELKTDMAEVKADVAELKTDMAEVKADVAELKTDMAEVKADVAELKTDVAGLKTEVRQINGRLDNGFGFNYELKTEKNIRSIAGQFLGLRSVRVLRGAQANQDTELADRTEEAAEQGVITWAENAELWRADLIFTGRNREGNGPEYVVAEVSITAGDTDVNRASRRAEILSRVLERPAQAVVIAANIDAGRNRLAGEKGVVLIQAPE